MKRFFDEYKKNHEIHKNLKFYEYNCAQGERFCYLHFKVTGYPAVIVFDNNGKEIKRISGILPQNSVDRFIVEIN